jgi:hypothetical protein
METGAAYEGPMVKSSASCIKKPFATTCGGIEFSLLNAELSEPKAEVFG